VTVPLTGTFATTPRLAEIFSNRSVVQAMLDVEAALALAQAHVGLIPIDAAASIARLATADGIDAEAMGRDARTSASLAIPLVAAFIAKVRAVDEPASRFVHWGATSQDVIDTAIVLLIGRAVAAMTGDHDRLSAALRTLSERHRDHLMLGRTLLQPAPPVTFGLKAARWFAAERASWRRLTDAGESSASVQLGGASGTLASHGNRGLEVADRMARALGLTAPPAPWHTDRDTLAALVAACGLYTGALGKIARDVALLMQAEVGEAFEPGGGSSTMPHKRNPAAAAIVLAAATRLPGLVSSMLSSLPHEHERAVGGWQAEWPTIADALQTTGSALDAATTMVEGLTIDTARMRANLEAAAGAVLAERVMLRASASLGRERAQALVRRALGRVAAGQSLADAVSSDPELAAVLKEDDVRGDVTTYLGQAEAIRRRLLGVD